MHELDPPHQPEAVQVPYVRECGSKALADNGVLSIDTALEHGWPLKSNAEMVERIVRLARDMNREIATPVQAREMLGLSPKPSHY